MSGFECWSHSSRDAPRTSSPHRLGPKALQQNIEEVQHHLRGSGQASAPLVSGPERLGSGWASTDSPAAPKVRETALNGLVEQVEAIVRGPAGREGGRFEAATSPLRRCRLAATGCEVAG